MHYEAAYYGHGHGDSYQLLKTYDVNISGLVSATIQHEARRLRAERWQAENQEGMAEVAWFIETNCISRGVSSSVRSTCPKAAFFIAGI